MQELAHELEDVGEEVHDILLQNVLRAQVKRWCDRVMREEGGAVICCGALRCLWES